MSLNLPLPSDPIDADLLALDQPSLFKTFTATKDHNGKILSESVFLLQGMHCAVCVKHIEQALSQMKGVLYVRAQLASQRARILWDPTLTRASLLAQTLRLAGYEPIPARSIQAENERIRQSRLALWRVLVAGFCMMQIMMYTIPAYYINPQEITPEIDALLRWAGWLLTLPVLLFSCQPFFSAAWLDLRNRRIGMDLPVSLGIVITFFAGTAATFDPLGAFGHELYFDSLAMFVFFLLAGRMLEQRLRGRTAGAIDTIIQRLPQSIERLVGENQIPEIVTVQMLCIDDIVRIKAGEVFPGDGILVNCEAQVDEALLTGESRPQHRTSGQQVIAGSYNLAGSVQVQLTRLGDSTRFAQIVALMERASDEKPQIAKLADRIAGPFLAFVLVAAGVAAATWWWLEPSQAPALPLKIAVAVLIVTCPCALSLATPAAMLTAAGAMARRGILIQRLQSIEQLADTDIFAFDKTGTLTQGCFALSNLILRPDVDRETVIRLAAAIASHSLHPISLALQELAKDSEAIQPLTNVQETAGKGLTAQSLDYGKIRLGSATHIGLVESPEQIKGEYLICYLSDSKGVMAEFYFDEKLKADTAAAISRLKQHGNAIWLLSGDRNGPVAQVSNLPGVDKAWSQLQPQDKLEIVKEAQAQGDRIAMVGDGLNDGPVLAQANVSFALGQAAPLSQSYADFIVLSGKPTDVAFAYSMAQRTLRIVKQNLAWAGIYNIVCIPLAVLGFFPPWLAGLGMAASSLAVVGNALRLAHIREE